MSFHKKKDNKYYAYYKCAGHLQKGNALCSGGTTISVARLEELIIGDLKDVSVNQDRLKEAIERLGLHSTEENKRRVEKIKSLKNRLLKVQAKKQKIFELYEEESINKTDFLSRKASAEEEGLVMNKEVEELENKAIYTDIDSYDLNYTLGLCKDMKEVYDELETPDRKDLIRSLLCEVKVNKHNVDYSVPLRSKLISYAQDSGQLVELNDTGRGSLPQPA